MLPKLSVYGRQELHELQSKDRPLRDHCTSLNSSMHARYLSYDEEPTEIAKLKKLKEFLCNDEDTSERVIVVKPESHRYSVNKENLELDIVLPPPKRRTTARPEPTENSLCEQTIFLSRQRFRLKEMIEPINTRFDPRKLQHRLCDRLRVSKIL